MVNETPDKGPHPAIGANSARKHYKLRVICPECRSAEVKPAAREQYQDAFFLLLRPHACTACGVVFPRPTNPAVCAVVAITAAALGVLALIQDVVSPLRAFVGGFSIAGNLPPVLRVAVGIMAAVGFACIAYIAGRAARYSAWYRRHVQQSGKSAR